HIVADIKIDIPRPRTKDHRFTETFSEYVAEIESYIGVTAGIS
ncbi:MAG: ABC transporter ATP-binding protein, partial [Corynebacterium sp.]|nr:ABC transporter ATP-binding protein [Corynebacterium sp.]